MPKANKTETKATRSKAAPVTKKITKPSKTKTEPKVKKTATAERKVKKPIVPKKAEKEKNIADTTAGPETKDNVAVPQSTSGNNLLEVCLILDCTGSMSSWINRSKECFNEIIQSIKDQFKGMSVRFAFVGYRDVQDSNRFDV